VAFDYTKSKDVAKKLLEKFGQSIDVIVSSGGTYDPATQSVTNATSATQVLGVRLNIQNDEFQNIQRDDFKLIVESIECYPEDHVTINGKTYQIKDVKSLNPSNVEIIKILRVGK